MDASAALSSTGRPDPRRAGPEAAAAPPRGPGAAALAPSLSSLAGWPAPPFARCSVGAASPRSATDSSPLSSSSSSSSVAGAVAARAASPLPLLLRRRAVGVCRPAAPPPLPPLAAAAARTDSMRDHTSLGRLAGRNPASPLGLASTKAKPSSAVAAEAAAEAAAAEAAAEAAGAASSSPSPRSCRLAAWL